MPDSTETLAQTGNEAALAVLLVEALNLQDVKAAEIRPTAPLFGYDNGSLGLDSIDALELVLALKKQYGVVLEANDEAARAHLRSVATLAALIEAKRV